MLIIILISAITANIVGIALHYLHKPSSKSFIVHILAAVNESTWEHLKLAFTPMLFLTFIQKILLNNEYLNVLEANLYGLIFTLIFIPVTYYPIKYLVKREVLFVSISIFVLAICLGYGLTFHILSSHIVIIGESLATLGLFILILLFSVFTFYPPKIFLFLDPITRKYGHKI